MAVSAGVLTPGELTGPGPTFLCVEIDRFVQSICAFALVGQGRGGHALGQLFQAAENKLAMVQQGPAVSFRQVNIGFGGIGACRFGVERQAFEGKGLFHFERGLAGHLRIDPKHDHPLEVAVELVENQAEFIKAHRIEVDHFHFDRPLKTFGYLVFQNLNILDAFACVRTAQDQQSPGMGFPVDQVKQPPRGDRCVIGGAGHEHAGGSHLQQDVGLKKQAGQGHPCSENPKRHGGRRAGRFQQCGQKPGPGGVGVLAGRCWVGLRHVGRNSVGSASFC